MRICMFFDASWWSRLTVHRYGMHNIYMEHRLDNSTGSFASHGVFLSSAAGADVILTTPAGSNASLVQYRMLGGTFDFYFFSGPTPVAVVEQYGQFVGTPAWIPYWCVATFNVYTKLRILTPFQVSWVPSLSLGIRQHQRNSGCRSVHEGCGYTA